MFLAGFAGFLDEMCLFGGILAGFAMPEDPEVAEVGGDDDLFHGFMGLVLGKSKSVPVA